MSDLRKAAEGAFAVLGLFSVGERPSASTVNDVIADLLAALAQPEQQAERWCMLANGCKTVLQDLTALPSRSLSASR